MTALVVGLGRADRGDDAVGAYVARAVAARRLPGVEVRETEEPADLMDAWVGHDPAVVVDAVRSGAPPGTVHVLDAGTATVGLSPAAWAATGRGGTHALGLAAVVGLARSLGRVPERLVVVGVEAEQFDHGARLSDPVAAAIPAAVLRVVDAVAAARGERVHVPR